MSIRMKLVISYIAMILLPLVMLGLTAVLLLVIFYDDIRDIQEYYGSEEDKFWIHSVPEAFEKLDELFAGLKMMSSYDPHRMQDQHFLEEIDLQFNELQAGLVVVQNDRITYATPLVDGTDLYEQLRHVETEATEADDGHGPHNGWGQHDQYRIHDRYTVEKHDFTFPDDSSGTVYMLADTSRFYEFVSTFFPIQFVSLLVAIGLSNGLLTYLISRSMIKPLFTLKSAAEQIKEGNLDQPVDMKRKDEIGQLANTFEEMRRRLKESIHLQLQYEENRKELLSNISHDLKTPITGINACVEAVREGIVDSPEKQRKYMDMIAQNAKHMDRLIDELFLFSKLDLDRLPFHFEQVDLVAFIDDYVRELRIDPQLQGVEVVFHFEGDYPVYVKADRGHLHRVMTNIVSNSIKYMHQQQKQILVELSDGEEEATVQIRDNGSGIEKESLPHIFDRFYLSLLSGSCPGTSLYTLHSGKGNKRTAVCHGDQCIPGPGGIHLDIGFFIRPCTV
jgi:signal transduction histidine kinase